MKSKKGFQTDIQSLANLKAASDAAKAAGEPLMSTAHLKPNAYTKAKAQVKSSFYYYSGELQHLRLLWDKYSWELVLDAWHKLWTTLVRLRQYLSKWKIWVDRVIWFVNTFTNQMMYSWWKICMSMILPNPLVYQGSWKIQYDWVLYRSRWLLCFIHSWYGNSNTFGLPWNQQE